MRPERRVFTITYVDLVDTFWVHCRVRATSVSDFRRAGAPPEAPGKNRFSPPICSKSIHGRLGSSGHGRSQLSWSARCPPPFGVTYSTPRSSELKMRKRGAAVAEQPGRAVLRSLAEWSAFGVPLSGLTGFHVLDVGWGWGFKAHVFSSSGVIIAPSLIFRA
jgi:hypothetical protein